MTDDLDTTGRLPAVGGEMSDDVHRVNDEVILRWTGTARFDRTLAVWASRAAADFAERWTDPKRRTGLRRGILYQNDVLGALCAVIYYTPRRAIVVRIHGDVTR